METVTPTQREHFRSDCSKIEQIIETAPSIDTALTVSREEYRARWGKVQSALADGGCDVGFVFCDEHYHGDVPYLGGNTNISVEQVAGVIGPTGFHIMAGLEGGYVAEQLAPRSGAMVHKVEMLKLADEEYPVQAERLVDVLQQAADGEVKRIGLLSPRQVVPAEVVEQLADAAEVVDLQEPYWRIKYEKSKREIELTRQAAAISDLMMRAMLAVLRPGMLETEVAGWAALTGKLMGAEENGFDVIVGSDVANRTLIGKALNRPVKEGAFVHLGVAPKREGLTACIRRSVIAVDKPNQVSEEQQYWFDLIEQAYRVGHDKFVEVAESDLPAFLQEKALQDFFAGKSAEVSVRVGRTVDLAAQKPYTGTHNAGYTECQEFYGAITLESREPLGNRIVTMLDVALRGAGSKWDEVVIPGFDYIVIENTLAKSGQMVECLNNVPLNVQSLVGKGME